MRTSHALFALALAALLACGGCCARKLDGLNKELEALYAARTQALAGNRSAADVETKLAGLAANAQQKAAQCAELAPAFYRVAAVAAWQAHGASAALVDPITTQGVGVCEALPAQDNTAPRDCTLIRIAAPMALQDELTVKQLAFREQAERAGGGTLPASDLPELRKLLEGYAVAAKQLAGIRGRVQGLDSPQALLEQTDRQRLIVYCNAHEALGLIAEVDGMTFPQMAEERAPLDAIRSSVEADGIDLSGPNTCRQRPSQDAEFLILP